jgi:anaerobic selenocysteine-containing dehydrogenase
LRAFIAQYPAEHTAAVTGVSSDAVRELAAAWVATPRASVHASTGINMGRQGTLAYWLVHMLSFVTGRLDAEGGNLKSDGFYPNARSGAGVIEQGYVDTEFGRLRRGSLPGTLLSHAILDSDQPVRA